MKKILCMSFLLLCPLAAIFGEVKDQSPAIPSQIDQPKTDNITGGLFFGLNVGGDFIGNSLDTTQNLTAYEYDKDSKGSRGNPAIRGITFEGRLGLIKTTKNIGVRIYGYYGRGFDNMKTFGLPYSPINADSYYQTAYLETQYYGGIIDILFGEFQEGDITGYFSVGGGYQFTDYRVNGNVSLGYENGGFLDDDIYTSKVSGKKSIQSPLASVGAGMLVNKHHLFEINLRYIFQNPTIVNDSETQYAGTAGTPFYKKYIPNDTPLTIRQNLGLNFNLTFNYMFIF